MAGFNIRPDAVTGMYSYLNQVLNFADSARENIKEDLLHQAQDMASKSSRWSELAAHLEVWDEHDRFWVGFRGPTFVSEAMAAEYGTEEYPPVPLMRLMDEAARNASVKYLGHSHQGYLLGAQ